MCLCDGMAFSFTSTFLEAEAELLLFLGEFWAETKREEKRTTKIQEVSFVAKRLGKVVGFFILLRLWG